MDIMHTYLLIGIGSVTMSALLMPEEKRTSLFGSILWGVLGFAYLTLALVS